MCLLGDCMQQKQSSTSCTFSGQFFCVFSWGLRCVDSNLEFYTFGFELFKLIKDHSSLKICRNGIICCRYLQGISVFADVLQKSRVWRYGGVPESQWSWRTLNHCFVEWSRRQQCRLSCWPCPADAASCLQCSREYFDRDPQGCSLPESLWKWVGGGGYTNIYLDIQKDTIITINERRCIASEGHKKQIGGIQLSRSFPYRQSVLHGSGTRLKPSSMCSSSWAVSWATDIGSP